MNVTLASTLTFDLNFPKNQETGTASDRGLGLVLRSTAGQANL